MFLPALVVVAIAEVAAFIEVGRALGWAWTVLLLLGISLIGTRMLGMQRRAAIGRLSRAVSERRASAPAAIDGALGFLGGVLLAIPGFVTDILGVVLLFGPTRRLTRRWIARRYAGRVLQFASAAQRFGGGGRGAPAADVDSTALDYEPDRLER